MAFHEIRFPPKLSLGSMGGPERRTEIVNLSNGFEERNTPWAHSRRRYDAGMGLQSLDDLSALIAFFEARSGQLHGFRWKDWADHKSCLPSQTPGDRDQILGAGDGAKTTFQLVRHYASGPASYQRPITKPVLGSLRVAVADDAMTEGPDYTVEYETGVISFHSPPQEDAPVTAGFEFDVPVRFAADNIAVSVASFQAGEAPQVPVIEVRL